MCARGMDHFVIGSDDYLVFSFNYNGTTTDIPSRIFKFNGTAFTPFQDIQTHGVMGWKFFTMNGKNYLAAANNGMSTYEPPQTTDSQIFLWDESLSKFRSVSHGGNHVQQVKQDTW